MHTTQGIEPEDCWCSGHWHASSCGHTPEPVEELVDVRDDVDVLDPVDVWVDVADDVPVADDVEEDVPANNSSSRYQRRAGCMLLSTRHRPLHQSK